MTYVLWLGSATPAIEVAWTAKPNLIEREGDPKPSNRNAASLYHILVRTPLMAYWPGERFDTMAVVLDLSQMASRDSSLYLPAGDVVKATVESIMLNAARGRPPVTRYVKLTVEGGPPEYSRLSKVYAVDRGEAQEHKGAAPAGTGVIEGKVTDGHGVGVQYVSIIIKGKSLGAVSDAAGNFTIAKVPVGTYTVTTKCVGFAPSSRGSVRVSESRTTTISLRLKAAPVHILE